MRQALRALGAFFLWNVAAGFAILLVRPPWGLLPAAGIFLWFLHVFVLRRGRAGEVRRRVELRLRPLSADAWRATLLAVPVVLVMVWAISVVWLSLVPVPEDALSRFEQLTGTPSGRLTLALFALVGAPLLEEFVFRGIVQWRLERRWGPGPAIAATAVVFALFHFNPWILPIHLFLGLAFGYAVWATRSIWAGVVLHAANNALAMLGLAEDPTAVPTVWETGRTAELWTALAVLLAAAVAAGWVARRLREAGRR